MDVAVCKNHVSPRAREDSPRVHHPKGRKEQQVISLLQAYEILFKLPTAFSSCTSHPLSPLKADGTFRTFTIAY